MTTSSPRPSRTHRATLTTRDAIADLELTLAGEDADLFELSDIADVATGARDLRFKEVPNYEAPGDANQDNSYKVTVVATDDESLTGELEVTVDVMNIERGRRNHNVVDPARYSPGALGFRKRSRQGRQRRDVAVVLR